MIRRLLQKPWLKWLGYPLFFGISLVVALHLTFPFDALKDRIAAEASERFGLELEIGAVRLAGLTGLTLTDVAIVAGEANPSPEAAAAPAPGEEEDGAESPPPPAAPAGPQKVQVDRITAKLELLPLLKGSRAVAFWIDAFGGSAEGRFEAGKEQQVLAAKVEKVALARTPLKALVGVDLEGQLSSAELELSSDGKDFSKANGKLVLKGESLTLNGGEVQGFELPKVVLGSLDGTVAVDQGKANVEKFAINGQDLEAQVEGFVRLAPRFSSSTLNGKLKFKPSDEWWNRNEMLKNMANFALPAGKDGFRTISLYGQLSRPNFRPQR